MSLELSSLAPGAAAARPARALDYLLLLKPRVVSLVVFTGAAGLLAAPGAPDPLLAVAVILAIAGGAGAAGALNMWYDADIDAVMRRTRMRPVPAGLVAREEALTLGLFLGLLAVALAALAGGPLCAGLLAFSIWFYAVVYTQWLKRRTVQNIVIGGLAGALPPAIGWAGASGAAPLDAWILVGIIFLWTPPHFWALALYRNGDYAEAGVPMLPVVAGEGETRRQIWLYSLAMVGASLLPLLSGLGGLTYGVCAGAAGLAFLALAGRVRFGPAARAERAARDLFAFSILYLFVLFGAVLFEHGFSR